MNVPNHEMKAFKDMGDAEKLAIISAKLYGNCDVFNGDWLNEHWDGIICLESIYRTRPRKLVIPWEHVADELVAAVIQCKDGFVIFSTEPFKMVGERWTTSGITCRGDVIKIDTTGIDWRESLTQRPE